MNKLEELHLDSLQKDKHVRKQLCVNDFGTSKLEESVATKSAEITEQIAVEFGNFLGKKCNWVNNSYYSYLGKTYTTKQLFQKFLKTKQ